MDVDQQAMISRLASIHDSLCFVYSIYLIIVTKYYNFVHSLDTG